ncbi:MAG: hypothetical protein AAFV43_01745 [Planctomycetota bacterium]
MRCSIAGYWTVRCTPASGNSQSISTPAAPVVSSNDPMFWANASVLVVLAATLVNVASWLAPPSVIVSRGRDASGSVSITLSIVAMLLNCDCSEPESGTIVPLLSTVSPK